MRLKYTGPLTAVVTDMSGAPGSARLILSCAHERTFEQVTVDWMSPEALRTLGRFLCRAAEGIEEGKQGKVPRSEVYEVIDGERDYQDGLGKGPGGRTDGQTKQVGSFLALTQHALNEALKAYYENQGDEAALHMLRKIVALGVQCGEIHGMPRREA